MFVTVSVGGAKNKEAKNKKSYSMPVWCVLKKVRADAQWGRKEGGRGEGEEGRGDGSLFCRYKEEG